MEILIENKRLYLWALIALCGEVKKQDLLDAIEASPQHAYGELRKLKEEKLLTETKTEYGSVLRIAYPAGTELLNSLPPLKDQYELMTSSEQQGNSGRFHNKGQVLKKRLERSKIILLMNSLDIMVNNIRIQYIKKAGRKAVVITPQPPPTENEKSNAENQNAALPENENSCTTKLTTTSEIHPTNIPNIYYVMPEENDVKNETCEELLKKASFQKPNYFTSNIIKRYKDGTETYTQTLAINPSRMQGAVMGSGSLVSLFYMENEKIKVSQKAEKAMIVYLDRIYKIAYGSMLVNERRAYAEKGIGIILTSEVGEVKNFINYPGENMANLTGIYSKVYLVDVKDKKKIERIITGRYEQEVIEDIFDDDEIRKAHENKLQDMCDALTEDNISLEAISTNLVKLEKSITLLANTNAEIEIFCKEGQQKELEALYSPYNERAKITVLDEYE